MKKFKKPDSRRGGGGGPSRGGPSRGPRFDGRQRDGRPPQQGAQQQRQDHLPQGRCVVGIHAVTELLDVRPGSVTQIWIRDKFADHQDLEGLHERAKKFGIRIVPHNPAALDKVVSVNQGVLAFSDEQPELNWQKLEKAERATLIALDEVEDPHNLGAIMRTAWLLGADGILTPEHRSASLSPAVSKVAQGAVEHIPVESDTALPERLKRLKDYGFWILGLSHKATQNLYNFEVPEKVVWVLGSESSGLRKSTEGACDDFISIPQAAPTASYNVSVAAAMALSETFRQRL